MRDWLATAAEEYSRQTALIRATGSPLSYRALSRQAARLAARLARAGVGPGDRVGYLGARVAQSIPLLFALARLRAVYVPFNNRLTPAELRVQIGIAGTRLLLCDRRTAAKAHALANAVPLAALEFAPKVELLPPATDAEASEFAHGEIDLDAVQSIVFTSGTTGMPKGAQITFGNHYHSALASAERLTAQPDDVWLLTLPHYHVGGMTVPMRAALGGTTLVEFDMWRGMDTARLAQSLIERPITHVSLVPTMLHRLLDSGFVAPPRLRAILLGGAAAPLDLLERAWAAGLPVATTYGLTEACSQVATAPPDEARCKPGTVGRPLRGATVTVVRVDGNSAVAGEVGELVVRGPTVFAGYLNAPEDRALRDGALFTGDLGYIDAEGDLFIVQRRTDLIVSGGENVYPAEIEAVLRAHPAVSDACVVGLPDPEWGQQVAAAVVPKSGVTLDPAALEAWCRERLAGYKRPRHIRIVSSFPLTASGKVIRRDVAALLARD